MKRTQISVQTIFYIFMAIIFVALLFFGYQKITALGEVISEQERLEIIKKLEDAFGYCDDPLNQGGGRRLEIPSTNFNYICIFDGKLPNSTSSNPEPYSQIGGYNRDLYNEVLLLNSTGHNVGLFKLGITSGGALDTDDFRTIDSFYVDSDENFGACFSEIDGSGSIIIDFRC